MSKGERTLVDGAGDYRYVVRDGSRHDGEWRSCRVVLTSERLVLATGETKQAIPHERIELPEDPPQEADAADTTALRIGDSVIEITVDSGEPFRTAYCRAALDGTVVLVKHPAVEGGVVRDTDWAKCRLRPGEDRLAVQLTGGETLTIDVGEIGTVDTDRTSVAGQERTVIKVEHVLEGTSVETHFSGTRRHVRALSELLSDAVESHAADRELSETESQVLMALYSGVSPFEMAGFVGIDVAEVEEIYQRLLEIGAVDKVRERTEVTLNAQGRNMASEAMNEE